MIGTLGSRRACARAGIATDRRLEWRPQPGLPQVRAGPLPVLPASDSQNPARVTIFGPCLAYELCLATAGKQVPNLTQVSFGTREAHYYFFQGCWGRWGQLMLADLMQDVAASNMSDWAKYGLAALGLVAFVGIYYIGDYLYRDREFEGPGPDGPPA